VTTIPEGRSLELYFIDGRPDGMLTAEVFNWTGHVLMTPRTRISAALARKEARYTGVYLLLGEQDGNPCAYVGESENISERIRSHDTNKEWWTTAVLITSTANNLNKAHVKYLEARLIKEAKDARRVEVVNGTGPTPGGLSEAARSNMEAFLGYLFMVLPALRVDMFIRKTRPEVRNIAATDGGSTASPRFKLTSRKHGLTATAVLQDGEFIVEAGSQARLRWEGQGSEASSYALLHEELRKTGVLEEKDGHCVFAENYAFSSPSAAAAVVNGRPAAGPREWRLSDGSLTYREWEEKQLALAAEQAA